MYSHLKPYKPLFEQQQLNEIAKVFKEAGIPLTEAGIGDIASGMVDKVTKTVADLIFNDPKKIEMIIGGLIKVIGNKEIKIKL